MSDDARHGISAIDCGGGAYLWCGSTHCVPPFPLLERYPGCSLLSLWRAAPSSSSK